MQIRKEIGNSYFFPKGFTARSERGLALRDSDVIMAGDWEQIKNLLMHVLNVCCRQRDDSLLFDL